MYPLRIDLWFASPKCLIRLIFGIYLMKYLSSYTLSLQCVYRQPAARYNIYKLVFMLAESHFLYSLGFKSNKRASRGGGKITAVCSWALNWKSLLLCISAPGSATSIPSHHCGDGHLVLSVQIISILQAWEASPSMHFSTFKCFQYPWLQMKE